MRRRYERVAVTSVVVVGVAQVELVAVGQWHTLWLYLLITATSFPIATTTFTRL
jgi:hypothetical protein